MNVSSRIFNLPLNLPTVCCFRCAAKQAQIDVRHWFLQEAAGGFARHKLSGLQQDILGQTHPGLGRPLLLHSGSHLPSVQNSGQKNQNENHT